MAHDLSIASALGHSAQSAGEEELLALPAGPGTLPHRQPGHVGDNGDDLSGPRWRIGWGAIET